MNFYESDAWRDVRYRALKLHGGCCQCCGARGSRDAPLHVDHIKPRSQFPGLALDLTNLQVLCADCNLGKSDRDQTDWREDIEKSARLVARFDLPEHIKRLRDDLTIRWRTASTKGEREAAKVILDAIDKDARTAYIKKRAAG